MPTTTTSDTQLRGELRTDSWTETTWEGDDASDTAAPKQTVAVVEAVWEGGAIDATSEQRWLMTYDADGNASYVGLERLRGTWDGHEGGCVLAHRGSFTAAGLRSDFEVVEGSGIDGWAEVRGSGQLTNPDHGPTTTWEADLTLPS